MTFAWLAVRVPVSTELLPTVTLPKLNVEGVTASCPEDGPLPEGGFAGCDPDETPAQPVSTPRPIATSKTPKQINRNRRTLPTEIIIGLAQEMVERADDLGRCHDLYCTLVTG